MTMVFRRIVEISRAPLFIFCAMVIIFLGIYFEVPLFIPPFVGSLYILFMGRNVMFRKIIGGHLIGFACAFIEPFITSSLDLNFLPEVILQTVLIGIAVSAAVLLMSISGLKHEPAIATVIIFFEANTTGQLIFGVIPLETILVFAGGLLIVTFVSWIVIVRR